MAIKPRTRTLPINTNFFFASITGAGAWALWPVSDWRQYIIVGLLALGCLHSVVSGVVNLFRDYRLRRDLAAASVMTTDHGSARQATWEEIQARGMDRP